MQHRCLVTVIDKKCYSDLQTKYLADPKSGPCPFYEVGAQYVFYRYADEDTFWTQGKGSQCSEAWDCISRYIYTALQGGSIMRNWTNDERLMIACCNDGTRPVIFKIERQDYHVVIFSSPLTEEIVAQLKADLANLSIIENIIYRLEKQWIEIYPVKDHLIDPKFIREIFQNLDYVQVEKID